MEYYPFDITAEQYTLAYCLENEIIPNGLTADVFYNSEHANIFKAFEAGNFHPDGTTATQYKFILSNYFQILGMRYDITSSQGEDYVKNIISLKRRRNAIDSLQKEIAEKGKQIQDCCNLTISEDELGFIEGERSFIFEGDSWIEESYQECLKSKPVSFNFPTLNKKIRFFSPTDVMGIAARSGVGKTGFGLHIVQSLCEEMDEKCFFPSLEMGTVPLTQRLSSMRYYEKNQHWYDFGVTEHETLKQIEDATEASENYFEEHKTNRAFHEHIIPKNIVYCKRSAISIEELEALVIAKKRKDPKIKNILIDYIQIVKDSGTTRREGMSAIARKLRPLAKNTNCRVIFLSQVARKGDDDRFVPIGASDFKESGDLEEVCDIVLGLWKSKQVKDKLIVNVAKNRNSGGAGISVIKAVGTFFREPSDADLENWALIEDEEKENK